jgi:hypothetical protein
MKKPIRLKRVRFVPPNNYETAGEIWTDWMFDGII